MQEEADVAYEAAWEVQYAGDQMEALRFQFAFEAQVGFGRFAPQGGGPVGFGHVYGAAVVAAELCREAKQQEFRFAMCSGLPGMIQNFVPAFICDVMLDGFLDFVVLAARRCPLCSVVFGGLF